MRTAPGERNSRCSPATRITRCATRRRTRTASTSFPRRGWIPSRRRSRASFPVNNLDRRAEQLFRSGPFTFDRHQIDSKFDYNGNSKFKSRGDLRHPALPHGRADGVRRRRHRPADRRKQQPWHGHGNTYRVTVMGTYIFRPTFLMDAHFGWARQGTSSEQPGLGRTSGWTRWGSRAPTARAPSRAGGRLSNSTDFATIGVNENFMPYYRHDPQSQYVVNFTLIKRGTTSGSAATSITWR